MSMEKNVLSQRESGFQNKGEKSSKNSDNKNAPSIKTGIMGGTFNPVHNGHLVLAQMAKIQAGLDEVWFMPSKNPPHKVGQPILSEKVRMELLKLSIEDNRDFSICNMELLREGMSYTYESLLLLKEEHPFREFYFIMGADSLFEFDTWKNPGIILKNAVLLAGSRELAGKEKMKEKIQSLKEKYNPCRIELIDIPEFLISSSEIRRMAVEGKSLRYLVPEKARKYIEDNGIYLKKE